MSIDRLLKGMLIFVPIALVAKVLNADPIIIFILAALGIIPLADLIGEATEEIAHHTGPKIGGLLNATFGNLPELIIVVIALQAGLHATVPSGTSQPQYAPLQDTPPVMPPTKPGMSEQYTRAPEPTQSTPSQGGGNSSRGQRRGRGRGCYYCGKDGQMKRDCRKYLERNSGTS